VSDGVVLVVLLTASAISDPTASALERAARDVLGNDATISVVSQAAPLTDEAAIARAGNADGVVEVSWDAEHRTAELHCYLARERRWLDRTITFDREDADPERGRLLGFAIGSMLVPEGRAEPDNEARPLPLPESPRADVRVDVPPLLPSRPPPSRWLEAGGIATTGVGGSAGALGVSLGFRVLLWPSFRLALGAQGLFGEIEQAQATSRTVSGSLGMTWQPLEPASAGDFGLALRMDLVGGWLEVSHLSEDDAAADRQSRFIGGGRAFVELALGLSESACVYGALGPLVVAGRTELYTHGNQVASIPPVWLTAEIGVRTAF
jgi:hypothetical protein